MRIIQVRNFNPIGNGSRERILKLGLAGILVLLMGLAACSDAADQPRPIKAHAQGPLKPFQLQTIEGESRALEDYLDQVTLVNFFFPT